VSTTHFLVIRHAESLWNADLRWQGQADPPLSARGLAQAEALAGTLRGEPADALYSSDLRRAWQTAEIVGRALDLEPRAEARLRELDVGSWSGLRRAEIAARDGCELARFEAGDASVRAGGGESRGQIRRRVRALFSEWVTSHPGARIVVVTHLGVIRALVPGSEVTNAGVLRVCSTDLAR
jgi:2,3-bisphosphoglycerate-dependent phosphoglycerate mutase